MKRWKVVITTRNGSVADNTEHIVTDLAQLGAIAAKLPGFTVAYAVITELITKPDALDAPKEAA